MEMKIDLKLLIDEVNSRVVFLECDGDFVDVLLSFLVMPIGAVVRLTEKVSGLGCMDALYESVEKLDLNFFQTQACKDLLLHPNYAHRASCQDLVIKIDDEPPYKYICSLHLNAGKDSYRHYSTTKSAKCSCGKLMDCSLVPAFSDRKVADNNDLGVFIKGKKLKYYMISDDLHISLTSTDRVLTLLKKFRIRDCYQLQEKLVSAGREEVLILLKRALVSKTPLTDVFLIANSDKMLHLPHLRSGQGFGILSNESEVQLTADDHKKMSMKLFLNKSTRRVLCAEAGEDVIDFLFSFLTFPLGTLPNLHTDILPLGCIHHLQSSIPELSAQNQLRTPEHSSMLLHPKLPPHHGCQRQILKIEEGEHATNFLGHNYTAINPKLSNFSTEEGGGLVKGATTFIITDELNVKIATPCVSFSVFRDSNVLVRDVEEKVVNIGEEEALMLLRASLASKSPLSEIFG